MRANKVQFIRGERGPRKVFSFGVSAILAIVGFLICQPFFWVVLVFGDNFHYITIPIFLMILGCIIGVPMMFAGLIGMLVAGKGPGSASTYNDHDMGRIRHAVETDQMNRKP